MNERESYLFDLNGYLVIENVLSPARVTEIRDTLDRHGYRAKEEQQSWYFNDDFLQTEEPCLRDLICHPKMHPYLTDLMGEGYRLDYEFGASAHPGAFGLELHGGATPPESGKWYRVENGRMYSGLTTVLYALSDVQAGEGAFCCLPGSHKSEFATPASFLSYQDQSALVQVPVRAGSVILFTEALTNGTAAYRGTCERKALFFKYSPRHSSVGIPFRKQSLLQMLTEEQLGRVNRLSVL